MAVFNVRDLLIDRLGVPVTLRRDATTALTVEPARELVVGNPARIGFALVNVGGFIVWVMPQRFVGTGVGFRLEPSGGALFTNWEEDGEMVAYPWFGLAVGGSSQVRSFEILIDANAPRSPREEG